MTYDVTTGFPILPEVSLSFSAQGRVFIFPSVQKSQNKLNVSKKKILGSCPLRHPMQYWTSREINFNKRVQHFGSWGEAEQVKLHSRATVCLSCEKDPQMQICLKIFVHDCRMDHIIFRVLGKFVLVCFAFACQICLCLFCDQEISSGGVQLPILVFLLENWKQPNKRMLQRK